jgi:hypothetical protein|tara:strand:- start:768 stop:1199 length:432 start_codon:yes stop_codon:yes gene_type:complete
MKSDEYTTPQVADIIGVPQRKILSYIERGYVEPSIQSAAGHGSKRLWSRLDIVRCAAIKLLLSFCSVDAVRQVVDFIKDDRMVGIDQVWNVVLINDKPTVVRGSVEPGVNPHEMLSKEWRNRNPATLVISFAGIHAEINTRIN